MYGQAFMMFFEQGHVPLVKDFSQRHVLDAAVPRLYMELTAQMNGAGENTGQSTLISTLLPSGSRTNVESPLPAAPLFTSACVGSKPLRLSVAITS